ncbi:response regulator transcription factor [Longitalea arenae]|uniref:response regulator transcription factor n=1 Tax=Longitalea arenae TaxID=2812558 RepID=UPI001967D90F|nr:response regulator transcription factor [Longitalea arenae]
MMLAKKYLIPVAISDDHAMVRQALKCAFLYQGKIKIVVEASSYSELLQKLAVSKVKIIIMDLVLPDLNSTVEAIRQIQQLIPDSKILILTMHNDDRIKRELLAVGVFAFIHKGDEFELLIDQILMASRAITSLECRSGKDIDDSDRKPKQGSEDALFSQREKLILKLIADGYTNMEISRIVFLSVRSIEQIRHKMKERANVTNTASLIDFAIRNDLIQ